MILTWQIFFTFPEPFYHHCWPLSGPGLASDFETEKKFFFLLPILPAWTMICDDLIVLHSWTLFVVTFADAKVVKHVEPVKLWTYEQEKYLLMLSWKNMICLNNNTHSGMTILIWLPVNLDKLLEEHDASGAVAFSVKGWRPSGKAHHVWHNHQYYEKTVNIHEYALYVATLRRVVTKMIPLTPDLAGRPTLNANWPL